MLTEMRDVIQNVLYKSSASDSAEEIAAGIGDGVDARLKTLISQVLFFSQQASGGEGRGAEGGGGLVEC
jgi:hypothetical protein